MKKILVLIGVFFALAANAQNYLITFAATGASTSLATVKVENLTKGTSLTLNGSDVLNLTITTGINSVEDNQSSELKIYPNPMTDNSTVEISSPIAGDAIISVLDMSGKILTQIQNKLDKGLQEFHLSGLKSGSYLISVTGSTYHFSGKLLCNSKESGVISIEKINYNQAAYQEKLKKDSKAELATVDMNYNTGDMLKFTGISGIYSTVKSDIPSSNETITFNFIACTDADNNNYPVAEIGTQVWMAKNLMTRKYLNGDVISPGTSDATYWSTATWGVYCWYNNDAATYENIYGALYNWYAVSDIRKLCPTDWHVPLDDEWTTLTQYLGGLGVSGGKLKSTTVWASPNEGATDEVGFSALPGGMRDVLGSFGYIDYEGWFWSGSEAAGTIPLQVWARYLDYTYDAVYTQYLDKTNGFSVRCVKD